MKISSNQNLESLTLIWKIISNTITFPLLWVLECSQSIETYPICWIIRFPLGITLPSFSQPSITLPKEQTVYLRLSHCTMKGTKYPSSFRKLDLATTYAKALAKSKSETLLRSYLQNQSLHGRRRIPSGLTRCDYWNLILWKASPCEVYLSPSHPIPLKISSCPRPSLLAVHMH